MFSFPRTSPHWEWLWLEEWRPACTGPEFPTKRCRQAPGPAHTVHSLAGGHSAHEKASVGASKDKLKKIFVGLRLSWTIVYDRLEMSNKQHSTVWQNNLSVVVGFNGLKPWNHLDYWKYQEVGELFQDDRPSRQRTKKSFTSNIDEEEGEYRGFRVGDTILHRVSYNLINMKMTWFVDWMMLMCINNDCQSLCTILRVFLSWHRSESAV